MTTPREDHPPPVPARATQGGEAQRCRVAGAEPAVWTERMLTALVTGLKGNQWFSLIDKVYAAKTLEAAWEKVNPRGARSDRADGLADGH